MSNRPSSVPAVIYWANSYVKGDMGTVECLKYTSFLIIKPDAIDRGLEFKILQRFKDAGMRISALEMVNLDPDTLKTHYAEHKGKNFFENLIREMQGRDAIIAILQGPNALRKARILTGSTRCLEAQLGTIRGDFGSTDEGPENLIHTSADLPSLCRELLLWFDN